MKEEKRKEFGQLISKLRSFKRMTQRQLGSMAECTHADISRLEQGLYSPGLDKVLRLEEALGFERVYINKNNVIMTNETYLMGSNDTLGFYEAIKDLPCFKLVELSKDKEIISALWNEEWTSDMDYDNETEICHLLNKIDDRWCCGPEEEYPVGSKLFWFTIDYTEVDEKEIDVRDIDINY